MDLSVIIVSYNTKKLLGDCLASLLAGFKDSPYSHEIIVVDNNSTDGSREMLQTDYPGVQVIENSENKGFGAANNQGISLAKGMRILLLNSDTLVINGSITKLYEFSLKHPKAFVGPTLLNPDHTLQPSCGPFFRLPVVFAFLFLKGDKIGLTRWSPKTVSVVDWISGACIMAPKKLFENGLLFDENIFMYMEEIDLLYRASRKGYKTMFFPGARIVHVGSASSKKTSIGTIANIFRGLVFYYRKHHSRPAVIVLRFMLKLKAVTGIMVGMLMGRTVLKKTYEKAFFMA